MTSTPCTGPRGLETAPTSRRDFLRGAGGGIGWLALASLLREEGLRAEVTPSTAGAAPGAFHHPPRAERVISLFMSGGPSHLETFDPKPDLQRLHGQPLPASFGSPRTRRGVERNRLLATRRTFSKHGACGLEVSDLLPRIAEHADDLCLLRGCFGDSVTHPESVYLMNTGSILMGRPSLGAWLSYGLGSESRDLPAFVVLPDPAGWVKGGAPAWGNGFLPASHQGTILRGGAAPFLHLRPPEGAAPEREERTRGLIRALNAERRRGDGGEADVALEARVQALELAFRMQASAPELAELSGESAATRRLYGLDDPVTAEFGRRCLLARRLSERGVRFVQVYCGDTNGWDGHSDIEGNHRKLAAQSDGPIAGLLADLKSRGMLASTLVIWGGEFGRTPMTEGTDGRDHNPHGFSVWLAGGGVAAGRTIGATDPLGLRAAEERVHVHDLHATILHLLGIDHRRLTFRRAARDERLTDVAGEVVTRAVG